LPFVTLLLLNLISYSQTNVPGGDVAGNWTKAGSPYLVDGNITVQNGTTLSIDPGVEVEFHGHYALTVSGRLLAIGTASDSILFTVQDTTGFSIPDTTSGGWYGIRFTDTPASNDSSKIVYCTLEFGKAVDSIWHLNMGGAICVIQFNKLLLSNSTIRNNMAGTTSNDPPAGGGLYMFKSNILVQNNIFKNNRARLGGAVYFDDSNPVFKNNIFEKNVAEFGAGVSMGGTNQPSFSGDGFLNNAAGSNGGGLILGNLSKVICNNVTFSGNTASWGGGVGVSGGIIEAVECTFSGNHVKLWGGGLACDFGTLHLENCTFLNDTSDWGSGGLHMDNSTAIIKNCTFSENNAFFGAGFHSAYSNLNIEECDFENNIANGGGGAHIEDSDCTMLKCNFQNNKAIDGHAGAIDYNAIKPVFNEDYKFTLKGCNFFENSASGNSGAVRIEQIEPDSFLVDVVIDSCKFLRNFADIYSCLRIAGFIDDFTVTNCIFDGNNSKRYSGGPGFIANSQGTVSNSVFYSNFGQYSDTTRTPQGASVGSEAHVDFLNCTFADSSSINGIGLSIRRGVQTTLTNCILWNWGNQPISVITAAELGSTLDINYCNIEYGSDSIFVSDDLSTLNYRAGNISRDPLFISLNNYDLHLQDSSPCIGVGTNGFQLNEKWLEPPFYDYESNIRPAPTESNADMGAYEHQRGFPVFAVQQNISDEDFILFANYPNPFRKLTKFHFELFRPGHVDLSIYNIFGQKTISLVDEFKQAGVYLIEWNSENLPPGQYLYRLKTGLGSVQTGKMVLLK